MVNTAFASLNPTRDDFAALLDESYGENEAFEGTVVKGTVVGIEKDVAVIDIGLKTEGRVPLREFTGPGREAAPKIGDIVEVDLERVENALGEAVISRDKARREESWVKLEKAFEAGEKVDGVIFNQVKGGFTVDLDGAVAFLPRSQVDIRPIRDVTPLMGVPQPFQILKMDRRRGNIVVSRRTVLEESRAEQRHEIVANLEEGQVIEGMVKNITDYGAFVDLGGIDGLLHVTDIAWRRVNHPTEVLNIGQTVRVKIIKINHDTHRISLGIKQLSSDPFTSAKAAGAGSTAGAEEGGDLKKGVVVTCEVIDVKEGGLDVKIAGSDLVAFIKRNELARDRADQRPERFAVGEKFDARIIQFDRRARKVAVSIKALEMAEEKEAIAAYGSADSGASLGDILGAALKARETK